MSYPNQFYGGESVVICPYCGAQNAANVTHCRSCGNVLNTQQPQYQQPQYEQPQYQQPQYEQPQYQQPQYQQPQYPQYQNTQPVPASPAGLTQQEFYASYLSPDLAKTIKTWCIVGYVMTGINLVLGFLNPLAFVDVVIQLVLLLGVHRKKNKLCAYGVLAYSIVTVILSLAATGNFTGWGWILVGIGLVSTFKKMEKAYQDYQSGAANQYTQF